MAGVKISNRRSAPAFASSPRKRAIASDTRIAAQTIAAPTMREEIRSTTVSSQQSAVSPLVLQHTVNRVAGQPLAAVQGDELDEEGERVHVAAESFHHVGRRPRGAAGR